MEIGMQEKRYLLNIEQMLEGNGRKAFFQEAFNRIDGERRQKALSVRNSKAQAASIGAGLLIQKALADYMGGQPAEQRTGQMTGRCTGQAGPEKLWEYVGQGAQPVLQCFSVEGLLKSMGPTVTETGYKYGQNGKPYLEGYPFQFNLSHSGTYVFCGVSEQEIGVDIQKIQGENELRLAKRFFSDVECQALEKCKEEDARRRMFFRMWVRKEAYGKLTGEGLVDAVGKNLWTDDPERKEREPDSSEGEESRKAGFEGEESRRAGFEGEEFRRAGFEREESRKADFEGEESRRAGFEGEESRKAGFEGEEFRRAGFEREESRRAGFEREELRRTDIGENSLIWEEYDIPAGYDIAVCRFR